MLGSTYSSQRRPKPLVQGTGDITCSYDLRGNLIEINEPLERVLGYPRTEILGANLRDLVDPASWALTTETILGQAGGGISGSQRIQVRCKSGNWTTLEMASRLIFENGNPVAVQAFGRDLNSPGVPAFNKPRLRTPAVAGELARFNVDLKQLHRLTTANYPSLDGVFSTFLKTGCEILELEFGIILVPNAESGVVRAAYGDSDLLHSNARIRLDRAGLNTLAVHRGTHCCSHSVAPKPVYREFQFYIATPILIGADVFGTLIFSSADVVRPANISAREKEVIELMAGGLGRFILEDRLKAERIQAHGIVQVRNESLELLAENRPLAETLSGLAKLVGRPYPQWQFAFLTGVEGAHLAVVAPGLPASFVEMIENQLCGPVGNSLSNGRIPDLAELAWNVRSGLICASAVPIVSALGKPLGLLLMLRKEGRTPELPNPELVNVACRMAGVAISQRQLSDRLMHRAQHDLLTGLPNRARMLELLECRLLEAEVDSSLVALVLIDLDRFKQINDSLGHLVGDRLLVEVAGRLRAGLLDGRGIAARVGGDQFAIVLPNPVSEAAAVDAALSFLDFLRAPYLLDGRELFVTASMGLSFYPRHACDASGLLLAADAGMFRAKRDGKNALKCFVPSTATEAIERLELENALRRALEKSEFQLNFQPIVSIAGELVGMEVLLSWNHPKRGRLGAKEFIPMAEETGLIVSIGSWVIRESCAQGARWLAAGLPVKGISVNVSALQFARPEFVQTVASALASTGFPPDLLELELTESLVLRDIHDSIHRMTQLQELGIKLAIDDFGTGYSSLSYLRRLPVTGLKIDQSFLRDTQGRSGTFAVIQTIVTLARNLQLSVVAEGVETLQELELLRAAGCDRVQGHLFGRALPASSIEDLLLRPDRRVPFFDPE